ncbi:MAG: GAF domain-containing protein [Cyclobacteriaceae bacterium]|nr:GAF domain-containing protein [Cyclobacteriaceae bacterium]
MAEELIVNSTASKVEKYKLLIPQIKALVSSESDLIANLSNIAAALKQGMGFFWVGFYIVKNDELVLGPFQGPIACTRIQKGKGVCGTTWEQKETIIVENVDEFPNHIACSSDSKSEIVLPAFKVNEVALILDVDSDKLSDFDEIDQKYLEKLMKIIEGML